jgi:hypothetical protein
MRSFVLAVVAALTFGSAAAAQGPYTLNPVSHRCQGPDGKFVPTRYCVHPTPPNCTHGVACGDTCIAKGKVCHIPPAH